MPLSVRVDDVGEAIVARRDQCPELPAHRRPGASDELIEGIAYRRNAEAREQLDETL
ncbi:MAG: hypothetical protein JO095_08165 [Alphaproteobacteria bacterium]|nr:hypothetical protein [Alphaproteobacteria bacterium]